MNPTNPVESWDTVYASQSSYVQPPSSAQAASGVVPLDTLPADWWNSMLYKLTKNQNATASELTDIMNEMISVLTAADIPPSSQSSQQLLNAIRKVSRTIATASTAGAVISSSASGKVSVDAQGVMTPNGLGIPSNLNTVATDVVSAINELYSTLTNYIQTNNSNITGLQQGKAPTNHASDQTTYGAGSGTDYGHVKLSDATNSTSGAGDGVAATPAAVKAAYDEAQSRGSSTNPVTRAENADNANTLENNTYRQTALQGLYVATNTESLTAATYTFSLPDPPGSVDLEVGSTVRITFRYALQSSANVTSVSLTYGGRTGIIKAAKAGTLKNVAAHTFKSGNYSSSYPYKVWDAYTTLELMWTGSEWLILGNPIVCSYSSSGTAGYQVYANGYIEQWQRYAPATNTRDFYIVFKETPIVLSNYNNNDVSRDYGPIAMTVTTSSFKLRSESNYSSGDRFVMYAIGY